MPDMPDVRAQTLAQKRDADDILEVLKRASEERKQIVGAQRQDSYYTDPVTGEQFRMFPITISDTTPGVVLTDGVAGKMSPIFEYTVPEGAMILLPPMKGEYYMVGFLQTDDGAGGITPVLFFPVEITVMDPFKRKTIGKAFSATVDEINNGSAYRARGHGTQYNGEFPVKAKNGDVIQFKAFCDTVAIGPAGAGVVRWTRISAPPGAKISRLAIRAATLGKVR